MTRAEMIDEAVRRHSIGWSPDFVAAVLRGTALWIDERLFSRTLFAYWVQEVRHEFRRIERETIRANHQP